jgi:diamine N-acetyltransferase
MLYGENIRLRAIERSDIPTFVRWFNDPEVRQYLLLFAPMSMAQEERWFENRLQAQDEYMFAVETGIDGQWVHIGNTSLSHVNWKDRGAVFGIAIGEKSYWNKGYGTAATRVTVRFAFEELNLNRVELEVYAGNERAMHVYEKVGFVHEGTRRRAIFRDGRYHDAHWMSILREEFEA